MLAIKPTTLATDKLVLRPLALDNVPALAEAAADGSLWDKRTTTVPRPDGFIAYVKHALALQEHGLALPFATVLRDGERVIGSTRFMNIDAANIGWRSARRGSQDRGSGPSSTATPSL